MSITAAELAACLPNRHENEQQAMQVLAKKYGDEFEISEYREQQLMDDFYKVVAFSEAYPEILFEAKVAGDGSTMTDEYVASRVCRSVELNMEKNLSNLNGYVQLKVQSVSKSVNSVKADMTVQEFMDTKPGNRFVVYMVCNSVQKDVKSVYRSMGEAFSGLECMSGNIVYYSVNEKMLKEIHAYLAENAKIDYQFDAILEDIKPVVVPFENGVIELSEEEFAEMAGDLR